MKKSKPQHGFSPIVIVLIIVALGIVGFVAWRIYDSTMQANNSLNNASTASNAETMKSDKTDEAKTKKIVVPYIDYEIEVRDNLNDLSFYKSNFGNQVRVHISTKSLEKMDSSCSPSEFNSPLGVIVRVPGQYSQLTEDEIPGTLVKQLDDYSVSYRGAQAACSDSVEVQNLQTSLLKSLGEALGINTN